MIVKWKTSRYSVEIERVECEKETEKCVFVISTWHGRRSANRRNKDGSDTFHDTWDEAHTHVLDRAKSRLITARRNLQSAQDEFVNVMGLKKPADA